MVARVRSAAEELGYVVDATARSLKVGRTEQLAFAVADLGNPVYVAMMRAIEGVVSAAGFRLVVSSTGSNPTDEIDIIRGLNRGYADGLIPGWHWDFISSAIYHSVLPALTIVLTSIAGWMLQMRNVMITTIGEDYVIAAQAKGLPSRRVIYTYAARNALLPQLQGFGLAVGFVVSGAIVMEIVFGYPGIGLLLLNAVTSNDYPLMQAIFLVITFAVLLANLIVDMIIVIADPRARRMEATS